MEEFLGVFEFGYHRVEIYVTDGLGGSFRILPSDKTKLTEMKIGIDAEEENEIDLLCVFLHEVFEFLSTRYLVRYELSDRMSMSHDRYTFLFNHYQMTEIMYSIAEGMSSAYPKLRRRWKKHIREKKRLSKDK